jgi:hypothetical protein
VGVPSVIYARQAAHDAREQANEFDKKRNLFLGYLKGRRTIPGGLPPHELEQVNDLMAMFDPPRKT